ncbi:MAG: hypothetical protein KJ043_10300 [Anaerolineae bacterium]|nr:hypothetical protein [Anaerolineae bacterium]
MPTRFTLNPQPIIAIRKRAERYPQTLADAMVVHVQTGFGAQSPAPSGAPPARKSGALSRSIVAIRVDSRRWKVVAGASYAPMLEYGTKRMGARPFFMRGFAMVVKNPPKL